MWEYQDIRRPEPPTYRGCTVYDLSNCNVRITHCEIFSHFTLFGF